ncbi:MAG: thiamine-phosphate kinase [Allosphingosinicella sp.]
MTAESAFIAAMRALATHPGARGLADDAAVLEVGGARLVLTHDMLVEGVHFLADDPPEDVAWKLVAVNLSDLAAKGASPLALLLGYSLGAEDWDAAFARGLGTALSAFGLPLIGGDTVSAPANAPRALGLTAIGEAAGEVPSRAGARPGDDLWVSGSIGDSGAGLRVLRGELEDCPALAERYRSPRPRLEAGRRLAPLVSAMMDVSDGLLLDAARIAVASRTGIEIDLAFVPLSAAFLAALGEDREARLFAATSGDDYELLFSADPARAADILALGEEIGLPFARIGAVAAGRGLTLVERGAPVPLPERLGYEHG